MTYNERRDARQATIERIRQDTTQAAARYQEILDLRMLLLDILDAVDGLDDDDRARRSRDLQHAMQDIRRRARAWGKKGDCV
jgi:hypothetical protein